MKRAILILFVLVSCKLSYAYKFKAGDLFYQHALSDAKVKVTFDGNCDCSYPKWYGDKYDMSFISIPEMVRDTNNRQCSVVEIGCFAFAGDTNTVNVILPSSIYSIGTYAFSSCTKLEYINLQNVSGIARYAFCDCKNLNNITLSEKLPSIGERAFMGCNSLLAINIPNSCTYVSASAFNKCIALEQITIPDSISFGEYVFQDCKKLKEIKLPTRKMTVISKGLFSGCTSLTSIDIPSNITTINESAFYNTGLDSIIVPNSVATIGSASLSYCVNLKKAIFPSHITKIAANTFYGDKKLVSFNLPDSLISIGNYAFSGCESLQFYILNTKITSIGNYAFSGCKKLTICVPATTTIGTNAFNNCKKVIYFTDRVGDYWFNDTILTGYTGTETDLHLPDTHNGASYVIGTSAFANLEAQITSVHVPSSVTSIRANAFNGCKSLKSVILPADLTDIATTAFANCDSINSVTMGMHAETPSLKTLFASSKNKTLKEFTLQQGSTIMGTKKDGNNYLVFANDTVLESIKIPYSAKVVADSAFMNCKHLRSIIIGSFSAEGGEPENMPKPVRRGNGINPDEIVADIHVGVSTFEGDTDARYITWMYIKNIAGKAFKGCTGLTECIIPNTVTNIDYEAFANCTGLKVVEIPSSVEKISNYAFSGCSGIENLTIKCGPSSFITSDGSTPFQFQGCDHIRNLKYNSYHNGNTMTPALTTLFGSALQTIEELEFLPGSDKIYWNAGVYTLANDLIGEMPKLSKVTIPEGVEYISFGAFKGCTSLKRIDLPNSLKTIANRAFKNCGLERVTLPYEVTSIENNVLNECLNLQEVEIGCVGMKIIPGDFCLGCPNLMHVHYLYYGRKHCLPTEIASGAFSGCTSLKKITIPESVEKINGSAYDNCIGVEQLVVEAKTPPTCYSWPTTPFNGVNRQNTLCVPKGENENYSNADVWKTFFDNIYYNWEATMLQREQQIKAEIEKDNAIISWAEEENAGSYDLALDEIGTESSTRTFTIPSYTADNNAPAFVPRKIISEEVSGIKFSVSGLKPLTTYYYSITARDEARNVLNSYMGSFTTDATEDVEVLPSSASSKTKILLNGQIYILRGDHTYTLTGQEIK